MTETKEWPIDRFLQWLNEIVKRDDRGTLAELRRGLSETTQSQAWEHLIPFCPDFENDDHRTIWCNIGGLAAILVPDGLASSEPWNNLGTTMHALAKGSGDGDEAKALKSFEPKFRRALSCDDVHSLCQIIGSVGHAAAAKSVPINLKSLFWDLWGWDDLCKREETRLRWAKQYFRSFEPKSAEGLQQGGEKA